jgi:DNA-binding response OmpR family regulator
MTDKKLKILIVDDNVQLRTLLRITFTRQTDYQLLEAENGVEGLKLALDERPNGLDLCRKIKASEHKSCFVVLLSGKGQQSDIDSGMQAGADVYRVKPFSPIELIDIVKEFQIN